jgi:hypothetical protein
MGYQHIVFLDGDKANPVIDALYDRDGISVVYHGADDDSVNAAFAFLRMFDHGQLDNITDVPRNGSSDDFWETDGYRMSANLGLGYIGLERITE